MTESELQLFFVYLLAGLSPGVRTLRKLSTFTRSVLVDQNHPPKVETLEKLVPFIRSVLADPNHQARITPTIPSKHPGRPANRARDVLIRRFTLDDMKSGTTQAQAFRKLRSVWKDSPDFVETFGKLPEDSNLRKIMKHRRTPRIK